MTTKIIMKLSWRFSAIWAVVWCLSSVVCFPTASAWAGDLFVDNVTVSTNAVICGKLEFYNGVARQILPW